MKKQRFETMDDFLSKLPLAEQNQLKKGAKECSREIKRAISKNSSKQARTDLVHV